MENSKRNPMREIRIPRKALQRIREGPHPHSLKNQTINPVPIATVLVGTEVAGTAGAVAAAGVAGEGFAAHRPSATARDSHPWAALGL